MFLNFRISVRVTYVRECLDQRVRMNYVPKCLDQRWMKYVPECLDQREDGICS